MQKSERPRAPREVTRKWLALMLAILVQLGFVAVLVFSVHWQNRKPEPVTAELYAPPVKAPAPEPPPIPVPQPAPPPAPAAVPPEPKVEKVDPRAADIALKARQEEERRKKAEADRKEAEARALQEAEDRRRQDDKKKLDEARARQQREMEAMRAQAEREGEARAQANREAQARAQQASQRAKAETDWIRNIQAKVRGNVIVPPDMAGNPEAIFEVVQLPTGEIIDVQLRKSSGIRAYDDAVQRAILKSSPLPRPERPEIFERSLTLKFRPTD